MVLELVFSEDEKELAQRTSKHIWDILYKDSIAPDVLLLEGGEDGSDRDSEGTHEEGGDEGGQDDTQQGRERTPDDESETDSDESLDPPSVPEDSINDTSPAGQDSEALEREKQMEVVEDTASVGSKD
jgi:hypothetical protein